MKLASGNIDCQAKVSRHQRLPVVKLLGGLLNYPFADGNDLASIFSNLNDTAGHDLVLLRVMPV